MPLFSPSLFEQTLRDNPTPLKVFRDILKTANQTLEGRFQAGESVGVLVQQRSQLMDELLSRAWSLFIPPDTPACALVAVGGYGRGELHPASDIDLLILLANDHGEACPDGIEQFLAFLWDLGLTVGHSVRTVTECREQAVQDITIMTNLLESRFLTGDRHSYLQMCTETDADHIWPVNEFFAAKLKEQHQRHHKCHDTAYTLEPNVKEGPGGLRDIQVIGWVAKRHFGATSLKELVGHGFLTPAEYEDLSNGQSFLWRVRYALHILAGREEDRLLFDYQSSLAKQFGYRDDDHHLAVEHFMQDYYCNITLLSRLNEMLLQLFQEAILLRHSPVTLETINKRFRIRNGFIEVTHDKVFANQPFALLEIFLHLEQQPRIQGVRAATIRLIREYRHLIDDDFRNDLRCRSLFMEILRQPRGITHELRRMNRYGILAAYFPAFGKIVGQMQYDLFHAYTVDDHILMVLRNLRRFTVAEFAQEFPLCSQIIKTIPKLEILYLAALFHDIAKGRGGNHSELGVQDTIIFCRHHGLSDFDTQLVAWLVRHHLLMSVTAQHKDISDPEIIADFAHAMGDRLHLEHLYLLTVADIRGTNPTLWNSWKDSLLMNLYNACRKFLRRGLEQAVDRQECIRDNQEAALQLLPHTSGNQLQELWSSLEDDYFMRHSADEIAWHSQAILNHNPADLPLIVIREETQRGGTEIFIYAEDQAHLFAMTTMALDQMGLNIVDARIITTNTGYTLDTFIVLDAIGNTIHNPIHIQEIMANLKQRLTQGLRTVRINRRRPRQLKHFSIATQVFFSCDHHNRHTIVELITTDRPGLLAQVGLAFMNCDLRLINAKIATFGERVEDVFFITDQQNRPLETDEQFHALRQAITTNLEENEAS